MIDALLDLGTSFGLGQLFSNCSLVHFLLLKIVEDAKELLFIWVFLPIFIMINYLLIYLEITHHVFMKNNH